MTTQIAELRVANLMTIDPVVIGPDATAAEAETLLKTYRVSGLPVVRAGEVLGVISQSDIMVARSSEMIAANWPQLRVRHLMSSRAVTVHAGATIRWAAHEMLTLFADNTRMRRLMRGADCELISDEIDAGTEEITLTVGSPPRPPEEHLHAATWPYSSSIINSARAAVGRSS